MNDPRSCTLRNNIIMISSNGGAGGSEEHKLEEQKKYFARGNCNVNNDDGKGYLNENDDDIEIIIASKEL